MNSNPKLKSPPLVEAIFDLRFEPNKQLDYALLAGQLNQKMMKKYPKTESLVPANLPLGMPGNILRHKFIKNNKKGLYQTGESIFAISTFDYKSFKEFLGEIKTLLTEHKKIFSPSNVSRLGLRYINKFSLSKKHQSILSLKTQLPESLTENEVLITRLVKDFDNKGKLAILADFNQIDKVITLDFDFFLSSPIKYDNKSILKWIDDAHNLIYKNFVECIEPDFFNQIK